MKNKVNYSVRTDLAYEQLMSYDLNKIDGISMYESTSDNIKVIKTVVDKSASLKVSKKEGTYYTIDLSDTNFHDADVATKIEKVVCDILEELYAIHNLKNKSVLIVGLGNDNVTPDSLGPYVLDNIVVTRHLFEQNLVNEGFTKTSAISPGVMGNTGIETSDIIKSIKNEISPDFIIVVDALAASSISRINRTIQIADTGISPGSGVGNKRKEISFETFGVPVIAIGVPTVVDAITITSDTIDYILKYLNIEMEDKKSPAQNLSYEKLKINYDNTNHPTDEIKEHLLGKIGLLSEDEKRKLIGEVLNPNGYNMMVTPKEIDEDIDDLAKIIATSIDISLHSKLKNLHFE